jgi:DNA-binding beta-propeller fold protein YncE
MTLHLSRSTKFMAMGIFLSLGWFVLESCDCDESKEDQYPGFWVTCIDNKPALMTYNGNDATVVTSDAAGSFDPTDWDCSHDPNSPSYKGTEESPPFQVSTPSGPGGPIAKQHATGPVYAFLPQRILNLPFVPHVPPNTNSTCSSSMPDVFQTNQTMAVVNRWHTCPFSKVATIPVVAAPLQVQITPDGSTAVVTSFNSAVNFIDLASNTVTYTLMTDPSINPHGLAISPDGTKAYITSFNNVNPVVAVIDMSSRQIIATWPTAITYPQGATLTPDGSQLWITSPLAQAVDIIDTLTGTHVYGLAISQTTDVAFNSTGTLAFITTTNTVPGSVVEVDTGSYQIVTTFTVGVGPTDIKMSFGDQWLVVNNNGETSVSVIDLLRSTVVTTQVGGSQNSPGPTGISFVQ